MILTICSVYGLVVFVDMIRLYQLIFHSIWNSVFPHSCCCYNTHHSIIAYIITYTLFRLIPLIFYIFPCIGTLWWLCIILSLTDKHMTNIFPVSIVHLYLFCYVFRSGFWSTVLCLWVPNIIQYICILTHQNSFFVSIHSRFVCQLDKTILYTMTNSIQTIGYLWKQNIASDRVVNIINYIILRTRHNHFIKRTTEHNPVQLTTLVTIDKENIIVSSSTLTQDSDYHWIIRSLYTIGGAWCSVTNKGHIWTSYNHKGGMLTFQTYYIRSGSFRLIVPENQAWYIVANRYDHSIKQQINKHVEFLSAVYRGIQLLPIGNKLRTLLSVVLSNFKNLPDSHTPHDKSDHDILLSTYPYLKHYASIYTNSIKLEDWLCSDKILSSCLLYIDQNVPHRGTICAFLTDVFVQMTQLRIMYIHIQNMFPYPRNIWVHPIPLDLCNVLKDQENILISKTIVDNMHDGLVRLASTSHCKTISNPICVWPTLKKHNKIN